MSVALRRPLIAGNWKLHKNLAETRSFSAELARHVAGASIKADIAVAPVFTTLSAAAEVLRGTGIAVYGQNLHWEESGAFTGEVSAAHLADAGCSGVIIGHSERRTLFGERDEDVRKKLGAALAKKLLPVVCVGETLAERESGRTLDVVLGQVDRALEGLSGADLAPLVIAYEPVWAIGTGRNASPEDAEEVHLAIRTRVEKLAGAGLAASLRILYGGSVKPANAGELLAKPNIDGALVGGASLALDSFVAIAQAAR